MGKVHLLTALMVGGLTHAGEILLEKVQSTATRMERSEKSIPAGVYTVTREEIETKPAVGTYELLEGISGVQATTRNGGYDVRLIIRGGGLKAPYAVREINVLLDGVPITDPDGLTRLDFVDTQLIERIELVKGPNSTLYGANSAGGVVNFVTVSPFKFQGFRFRAGYGRYNTYLFNLLFGGRSGERIFYNFGTSYKRSESWRKWNNFESYKSTLKIGLYPDARSILETTFSFTRANLQLPGYLTKEEFERDPSQQTSSPWRKSFKSLLYLQRWSHYHPVTARIVTGGSYVMGADSQLELKHRFLGVDSLLLAGFQIRYDHYNSERFAYKYCRLGDGTYDLCTRATRTNPID